MTNPESSVLSDINALIDGQLSGGPVDDFSVNRYDKCQNCHMDWHGLPNYGCPGSLETLERPEINWSIEVGQESCLAVAQRLLLDAYSMLAGVMGLPEDVFDVSQWCHPDAFREIQQHMDDGAIVEMARDIAMPPVPVPDGFVRLALEEGRGR